MCWKTDNSLGIGRCHENLKNAVGEGSGAHGDAELVATAPVPFRHSVPVVSVVPPSEHEQCRREPDDHEVGVDFRPLGVEALAHGRAAVRGELPKGAWAEHQHTEEADEHA